MCEASVRALSRAHIIEHLADYLAVHADVSPWTRTHLVADRPRKWELSFALWTQRPIAYCIMSERLGLIHINQFMVSAAFRGCGVGARMLGIAMDRGANSLKVHPDNPRAVRFYSAHGWIRNGSENGYLMMYLPPGSA